MPRPLDILAAIDAFSFSPAGGAGTFLFETARRLVRRGHRVTVFARRREDLAPGAVVDGVRFETFPGGGGAIRTILRARRHGRRVLKSARFDIVWSIHPFAQVMLPGFGWLTAVYTDMLHVMPPSLVMFIPKILLTPVHYTFLSPWGRDLPENRRSRMIEGFVKARLERIAVLRAERFTVLSRYSRSDLVNLHPVDPKAIAVVPGGVDLDRFRPVPDRRELRRALNIGDKDVLFLTVRRLVSRMGLLELVRAFERVVRKEPAARLVIGGEGPLRPELERAVAAAGLTERVTIVGFIPSDDLPRWYAAADAFVLPTQALEGFGLVILEAMACGTPALGTPAGAIPETLAAFDADMLLDGVTPDDIATGILKFLGRRAEWEMLRRRSREFAEGYAWDRTAEGIERELFKTIGTEDTRDS
ncbi:MAG: glycosyltransferase family 4 protein [Planctomycetota bacterium]